MGRVTSGKGPHARGPFLVLGVPVAVAAAELAALLALDVVMVPLLRCVGEVLAALADLV